ncbi:MAG: tyrosine-type recombinase/integrase [Chitinophagales bacterium]|nr:tyrosine-type recombinase/integrase [Chitinophagales bacterium]
MPRLAKELDFFMLFDDFINHSRRGRRLQPNGKRISVGTLANYGYTRQLLQSFCTDKGFTLRIRPLRRLNSRELATEKNYWKKFFKKFTDYLYDDCGHYDNYVGQNTKIIKAFLNYVNKELVPGAGEFNKLFYVRNEEIAIHPLLPEELNFLIYNKPFEQSLSPRLREIKDVFVFGCTVALRVSDLLKLNKSNLRETSGQYYLAVRSQKTATDTLIRLPDYAVAILDKYKKQRKKLLPSFNKVNLNGYIKELLETAGFTQPVSKTRERRGRVTELKNESQPGKSYRFCDLASTHTMRRTAITTMLSLGMPEQVVRKISGHAPGSKEFYRYVLWAQTYQDQETDRMFARLKEKTSLSS